LNYENIEKAGARSVNLVEQYDCTWKGLFLILYYFLENARPKTTIAERGNADMLQISKQFSKTPPYYYILYCSVFSWFKRVLHFECVEIGRASNLGVCVV